MKKFLGLLVILLFLNGCAESVALLGTSVSNGKIIQSSISSSVSYGIKKQTGKTPLEHAIAYVDQKNPQKKKEPCLSFVEKTNSEICAIVKKQLKITKYKILEKSKENSIKDLTSSLQLNINKKSKIKYLD
jgi:mannose/fructose/N-acetylgalactosamine-specific phosphotransferase system component IIB